MTRRIGLTGGIGSGKSAVSSLLATRGAAVVDADELARQVVAPGGPAYGPLVARFGPGILLPDGTVDRPALAAAAFADPAALADLNAITHPAIGVALAGRLEELDARDDVEIAVAVIPLLSQRHVHGLGLAAVVVVDVPPELAIERLVRHRQMAEADARARLAAQMPRDERLALADFVVDNSGSPADLERRVDELWDRVRSPGSNGPPGAPGDPGDAPPPAGV